MLTRRKFLVQSASSLALALGAARLAKAAVAGWAQQQGGSQDLQTGLVWLDWTILTNASLTYPEASTNPFIDPYTNQAFVHDGFNDWRAGTVTEMTTAVSHGLPQNCPLYNGPGPDGDLWWSSTTGSTRGGKGAYGVNLTTGASQIVLISSKLGQNVYYSALYGMLVRKGTL